MDADLIDKIEDVGLDRLLRPIMYELYGKTTNVPVLAYLLYSRGVLPDEIEGVFSAYERILNVYSAVMEKNAGRELLEALRDSNNIHIIKLIQKQLEKGEEKSGKLDTIRYQVTGAFTDRLQTDSSSFTHTKGWASKTTEISSTQIKSKTEDSPSSPQRRILLHCAKPTVAIPTRRIKFGVTDAVANFLGRETELVDMKSRLIFPSSDKNPATDPVLFHHYIVHGGTGMGKTELVRKFIQRHQKNFKFILWLDATHHSSLQQGLIRLADKDLEMVGVDEKNFPDRRTQIYEKLLTVSTPCPTIGEVFTGLIVLDNAEEFNNALKLFMPPSDMVELMESKWKLVILVTTRNTKSTFSSNTFSTFHFCPLDNLFHKKIQRYLSIELKQLKTVDAHKFDLGVEKLVSIVKTPLDMRNIVQQIKNKNRSQFAEITGHFYTIEAFIRDNEECMKRPETEAEEGHGSHQKVGGDHSNVGIVPIGAPLLGLAQTKVCMEMKQRLKFLNFRRSQGSPYETISVSLAMSRMHRRLGEFQKALDVLSKISKDVTKGADIQQSLRFKLERVLVYSALGLRGWADIMDLWTEIESNPMTTDCLPILLEIFHYSHHKTTVFKWTLRDFISKTVPRLLSLASKSGDFLADPIAGMEYKLLEAVKLEFNGHLGEAWDKYYGLLLQIEKSDSQIDVQQILFKVAIRLAVVLEKMGDTDLSLEVLQDLFLQNVDMYGLNDSDSLQIRCQMARVMLIKEEQKDSKDFTVPLNILEDTLLRLKVYFGPDNVATLEAETLYQTSVSRYVNVSLLGRIRRMIQIGFSIFKGAGTSTQHPNPEIRYGLQKLPRESMDSIKKFDKMLDKIHYFFFDNADVVTFTRLENSFPFLIIDDPAGKDTTMHYIERFKTKYDHIICIDASSSTTINNDYRKLIKTETNWLSPPFMDGDVIVRLPKMYSYLCARRCLIVFQNAASWAYSEGQESLQTFLPTTLPESCRRPDVIVVAGSKEFSEDCKKLPFPWAPCLLTTLPDLVTKPSSIPSPGAGAKVDEQQLSQSNSGFFFEKMNSSTDSKLISKLEALGPAEFENFLREFIDELAKRTANITVFRTTLLTTNTLAFEDVQNLKDKTPYLQNFEIYTNVIRKNHPRQLIGALKKSGNFYIVDLIREKIGDHHDKVEGDKVRDLKNNSNPSSDAGAKVDEQQPSQSNNGGGGGHSYQNIYGATIVSGNNNVVTQNRQASALDLETLNRAIQEISKAGSVVPKMADANRGDDQLVNVDGCIFSKQPEEDEIEVIEIKKARVLFINNGFNGPPASVDIPAEKYKYMDDRKTKRKRRFAAIDSKNLKNFFEQILNYDFTEEKDVTSVRLPISLGNFQASCLDDEECDACIVVIGTHGGPRPFSLMMNDLEFVDLYNDIVYKFGRTKFPLAKEKPIIFLVNACQKYAEDILSEDALPPPATAPHDHCGVLVGTSSIPYQRSYSHPFNGSLYLAAICKIFAEKFANTQLTDMLNLVSEEVVRMCKELSDESICQVPTHYPHCLNAKVYFRAAA